MLVRRDNVEHLLMIGGPSDVVVEHNIVRAVPRAIRRATVPVPRSRPSQPRAARRCRRVRSDADGRRAAGEPCSDPR